LRGVELLKKGLICIMTQCEFGMEMIDVSRKADNNEEVKIQCITLLWSGWSERNRIRRKVYRMAEVV
jgi:hypothetical protein